MQKQLNHWARVVGAVVLASGCTSPGQERETVWREDSVEISVYGFSYWEGGSGFREGRDLLTGEQLRALAGLDLVDNRGECMMDVPTYRIEIRDADGSIREYSAGHEDSTCEGPAKLISQVSLGAFMSTYSCLNAAQTRWGDKESGTVSATIGVNDGCEHGFFGGPTWVRVSVDEPGSYTFRGVACEHNDVTLTLYSDDGQTLLDAGAFEPAPGCWGIEHEFQETGSVLLRVNGTKGDYFVRLTRGKK